MPVSKTCDASANVNAALRESLNGSCAAIEETITITGPSNTLPDNDDDTADSLHAKLAATSKRVLLTKIECEEADNYSHSVLESYKSKYIILQPNVINTQMNGDNRSASPTIYKNGLHDNTNGNATDIRYGTEGNGDSHIMENGNSCNNRGQVSLISPTVKLPQPARILYPRENIRIGWKNSVCKWQVGAGMMNVGNTCYLNSTLQALFHVPSMANWLMSEQHHIDNCEATEHNCIICSMAKTLQATQTSSSAIRPYFVYSKLKSICKHLATCRQEDAHEFLRYLVESMEKSYLSRFRNYKDLDQYTKETTPLNQIFGGYLRSAVRCLSCNHVSITFQHFQDLLLDIRKADTIEQALDGYFSRERLEDMGYKCESCKKKVSATKQFSLERAPIALCIQLKRFSILGTKLSKHVAVKTRIDLTRFYARKNSGEQLIYRLVSMISHLGTSQHCGHYTTIGLTDSGTYYDYDDSFVRPISLQNVGNANAYILFYEIDANIQRHLPNAQINGVDVKENVENTNGYIMNNKNHTALQPLIGPQLPPGGLHNHNSVLNNNVIKPSAINGSSYTNGNKTFTNKQQTQTSNGNPKKIMIHFKSNNTLVKSNISATTTTSSTATISHIANGNYQMANISSNGHFQNGHNAINNKTVDTVQAKSTYSGWANQGQPQTVLPKSNSRTMADGGSRVGTQPSASTLNGHTNSSSDEENAGPKSTLPSMPVLNFNSEVKTLYLNPQANVNANSGQKASKSLVPYDTESEEETKRVKPLIVDRSLLKRRSISTSSTDDNDKEGGASSNKIKKNIKNLPTTTFTSTSTAYNDAAVCSTNAKSSNGVCQANTSKMQTFVIEDIFKLNNKNNQDYIATTNPSNGKQMHQGHHESKSRGQHEVSASALNNDKNSTQMLGPTASKTTRPFKRSQSTPPVSPIIKTKTGFWQVTTIQTIDGSENEESHPSTSKYLPVSPETSTSAITSVDSNAPKNPKNPFATKKIDSVQKRFNGNGNSDKRNTTYTSHNGYPRDMASDGATIELTKQSHRGYGASVLTWNGQQTEIEKQISNEDHEQNQYDWDNEEESEMDRGRQRKVKGQREMPGHRTYGYNPFQEQENQRRWKHGGAHNRAHNGQYRNHYQRNKFKFQRFNQKFQRSTPYQRNNNNHSSNTNNNSNGNNYGRRDT